MVKVLPAYAPNVFSSRRVAAGRGRGAAGAGGGKPSATPDAVRVSASAPGDFQAFVEVAVWRRSWVARLGKLSIDGTKVRANASKRKAMSTTGCRKRQRLESEIEALLRKADALRGRGRRLGAEVRGDRSAGGVAPAGSRLAAIQAAKARPKQRAATTRGVGSPVRTGTRRAVGHAGVWRADEKAQSNFTDPRELDHEDSSEGFQQCYNAQAAVARSTSWWWRRI